MFLSKTQNIFVNLEKEKEWFLVEAIVLTVVLELETYLDVALGILGITGLC